MVHFDGFALGLLVVAFKVKERAWQSDLHFQQILELVSSLCQGFETLVLTDVGPGGLNVGNLSRVKSVHVLPGQIDKHSSRDRPPMDRLGLHFAEHALSQRLHLPHKA